LYASAPAPARYHHHDEIMDIEEELKDEPIVSPKKMIKSHQNHVQGGGSSSKRPSGKSNRHRN